MAESIDGKLDRVLAFMAGASSELYSLRADLHAGLEKLEADRTIANHELRGMAARLLQLEGKYASLLPPDELVKRLADLESRVRGGT